MASRLSSDSDLNQVIFEEKHSLRKVILNRPQKLNSLTQGMVKQMKKVLEEYEVDDTVRLIILTGQGKAFCAGGDVAWNTQVMLAAGHWSFGASFYRKQLLLDYLIATYKKPSVILMNGVVMGGGAGLSMNGSFRVVTENTVNELKVGIFRVEELLDIRMVFAMPECAIGLYPDVGASYFLSRLSGHFGEYLGLTGARISGAEMLACGLATHFVFSKDLESLENELGKAAYMDGSPIPNALEKFLHKPNLKQDSAFTRLAIINKCFSKKTVEDVLSSLETEVVSCGDKWIVNAINSMKSASPTSLKICLKSIREGRNSMLEECLRRDYTIFRHIIRGKLSKDYYEGARAVFFDKDKRPKWNPLKLEEVSEEFVNKFFQDLDNDDDWDCLGLSDRKIMKTQISKL